MQVAKAEIREVTETVWTTMLGLALHADPEAVPPEGDDGYLRCKVDISGPPPVAVTLCCSEHLARRAAGTLLDEEPWKLDEEEVLDALRELTNMIGGNMKSVVPSGGQLSLPSMVDAATEAAEAAAGQVVGHVTFESEDECLRVTLVQRDG